MKSDRSRATVATVAVASLLAGIATAQAATPAADAAQWEGWIVGEPCTASLTIQDCPLRYVDASVLLLESGEAVALRYGEGSPVRDVDIDAAYGKRVRVSGAMEGGALRPVRMDLLEQTGERTFFKGCL